MLSDPLRVGVFGAGAVGCHVGVHLAVAGARVVLLGRPWLTEVAGRLEAVNLRGGVWRAEHRVQVATSPGELADHDLDICLLSVKSQDTEAAAEAIADVLPETVPVVSLQNGLLNPDRLRARLRNPILGGVVAPNIVFDAPHRTRQATAGGLFIDAASPDPQGTLGRLDELLGASALKLQLTPAFADVAAGKLLMNLNNGVCAATGLTIPGMLADDGARRAFAACIAEGLRVLRADGFSPRRAIALPPSWVARLLGLPSWLVGPAARVLVSPDPTARGSTLQDIDRGRRTEIDDLNGDIVARAQRLGLRAPVNAAVTQVVRRVEADAMAGEVPRFVAGSRLLG